MKLKKILIILLIFPTILVGQNKDMKLDSIFNMHTIDITKRPVYLCGETNPTLLNGEGIETYFFKKSKAFQTTDCCAFKIYIGFVVEADSKITNRKVFVQSVFCKDKGLIYSGQEQREIQLKIESLLDKMPKLISGKLKGKNVAIRVLLPLHFDCREL